MDRLAATLACKADSPVKVRMEAKGQFLEYVVDGKHPEAVISASLNGSPFQMIPKHNQDGSWTEDEITGTGFPRVFYLKYDMYRNTWPLLAFATYQKICDAGKSAPPGHVTDDRNGHLNGHASALAGVIKSG